MGSERVTCLSTELVICPPSLSPPPSPPPSPFAVAVAVRRRRRLQVPDRHAELMVYVVCHGCLGLIILTNILPIICLIVNIAIITTFSTPSAYH